MTDREKGSDSISINAFGRHIRVSRVMGQYGPGGGPTIVVIAGLHGNETAGVVAFQQLIQRLVELQQPCRGRIIGLAGNLAALRQGVRYIDADLNRLWRLEIIQNCGSSDSHTPQRIGAEYLELRELYTQIQRIQREEEGPFYFVDLHTTSSISPPFIPFDDTLSNRVFVQQIPVPRVLGIEEFLPGTLLSYLAGYGVIAFGYEAGKHDDPRSVDYHRALLTLILERSGVLKRGCFPDVTSAENLLRQGSRGTSGFYEIRFRYSIQPGEEFQMLPGFESFRLVKKSQQVATNRYGSVSAEQAGHIFMPLYQAQGEDGFFLIRRVPRFWLELSKSLRRWRLERIIARMPGVQSVDEDASTLLVNPRTARFLSRQVFHLLGYRQAQTSDSLIQFTRRNG